MSAMPTMPFFTQSGGALIASPDSALRQQVLHRLNGRCRPVQQALGGADALAKLEKGDWQVLFLDRRLPDLDTEELLAIIQRRFPGTQVVMLDSEDVRSSDEDDHDANRTGEHDANLAGPGECGVRLGLSPEPRGSGEAAEPLPEMIGTSEAMQRVYRMVRLVAARSTTVLIAGPTGTGKELVARALHALSPRSAKPMVVVNCAAIPEALLESELFGYTRGAFTGAVQSQLGRIAAAHGGTLFLDEVSELPLGMQAKLLRFLEQKEIQRLGASEVTRVDVRVLAASNTDLAGRAARGDFRLDLFYRLSAFPIELPTLAERRADIVPLAEHFLACMSAAMAMPCPRLSDDAIRLLESHPWRGNVRELQHVMERASILVENGDTIAAEHLYFSYPHNPDRNNPDRNNLDRHDQDRNNLGREWNPES
ncbi:MAG TPA: sigma-54 dependent transcriptional regulator [Candidatus Sulfotelmatobacter sp.]|nr:sigma-54 dependent transcriptional regulator [Candidatus Sulfotelmatobacter sp.]